MAAWTPCVEKDSEVASGLKKTRDNQQIISALADGEYITYTCHDSLHTYQVLVKCLLLIIKNGMLACKMPKDQRSEVRGW